MRFLTTLTVLFGASLGAANAADPLAGKRPIIVFVLAEREPFQRIVPEAVRSAENGLTPE
jgi:hypothetical protein